MSLHYESSSGEHASRKKLISVAKNVEAENSGGVNQKFFKTRFVQDNYHSLAFFKRVCKTLGNVKNEELAEMERKLLDTEEGKAHQFGEVYVFAEDDLYNILISHEICKRVCDKQGYQNWQDIIFRFI